MNRPRVLSLFSFSLVICLTNLISFQWFHLNAIWDAVVSQPLPSYDLWPQTDDQVRRAILQGIRIDPVKVAINQTHYQSQGVEYESPPSVGPRGHPVATLISAFYDVPYSKHKTNEYQAWLANFLSCTDPLVFFCDPSSDWPDFVYQHRLHAPTLVVTLPFDNFTTVRNFDDAFWMKYAIAKDTYGTDYIRQKKTQIYKVWHQKIIFVQETAVMNPFQTEYFFWIDAGYFRDAPILNHPIVRNRLTSLPPNQVFLQNAVSADYGYLIAGGAWGGSLPALTQFYQLYWKTFWYMVLHDISIIGYEQHVLVHLCKSFPDNCLIHDASGWQWFEMGQVWLPDINYNVSDSNPNFLRLDSNITMAIGRHSRAPYVQTVVQGEVDLPRNFPIVDAMLESKR